MRNLPAEWTYGNFKYCRFLMQILTQGGGYITVHSVRSNEASFYIMDYEESNEESYDKK